MPYGNAVGTLLYLATSTPPNISFTVATLCRFIANPGVKHWNAVKQLLHYLQGTKDCTRFGGSVGLVLPAQSHNSGMTRPYLVFHFVDHPWLLTLIPLMFISCCTSVETSEITDV